MRRILRTGICIFGLAAAFGACSQSEGGRCQVNSDCASGLECRSASDIGNGRCERPGAVSPGPDAAPPADASVTNRDLGLDSPSSHDSQDAQDSPSSLDVQDARDSVDASADSAASADGATPNRDGAPVSVDTSNGPDIAKVVDVAFVVDTPVVIDSAAKPQDVGGVDSGRVDAGE